MAGRLARVRSRPTARQMVADTNLRTRATTRLCAPCRRMPRPHGCAPSRRRAPARRARADRREGLLGRTRTARTRVVRPASFGKGAGGPRGRRPRRRTPGTPRRKLKDKKSKKKHKKKKAQPAASYAIDAPLPVAAHAGKKKKRKASSSDDDDSADVAAAAVEPACDDGVGGADVLPRRLAHFEALLTDALERRPAKKKRGNML